MNKASNINSAEIFESYNDSLTMVVFIVGNYRELIHEFNDKHLLTIYFASKLIQVNPVILHGHQLLF